MWLRRDGGGGGMILDVPADDRLHCVMIFSCPCPSVKNGRGGKDMAENAMLGRRSKKGKGIPAGGVGRGEMAAVQS